LGLRDAGGKKRKIIGIISFAEVTKCPELRLDPEHYIPRHGRWSVGEVSSTGAGGSL